MCGAENSRNGMLKYILSFPDVSSGVVGKCAMNYKLSCVHVYNNVRRYAWNFRNILHFHTSPLKK